MTGMKFDTAWVFYRSNRKMAAAAQVSDQAVSLWKKKGIVPFLSAKALAADSHGKLKVNQRLYRSRPKKKPRGRRA